MRIDARHHTHDDATRFGAVAASEERAPALVFSADQDTLRRNSWLIELAYGSSTA